MTPLRPVRDALLLRLLCLEPDQYGTVLAELDVHERACRHRLDEARLRRARVLRAGRATPIALLALAAEMLDLARQIQWLIECRAVLGGGVVEASARLSPAS